MNNPLNDPAQSAKAEIERLHVFIEGWYRGTLTEDAFEDGFAARLHAAFENIQPAGTVLSRTVLLDPIRAAYGKNPDFKIVIHDVRLLGVWPDASLILASYIESQTGARNSASANDRRSTVLFEAPKDRLIWRYLHETALSTTET